MTLDEAREHVGRRVEYRTPGQAPEQGVIIDVRVAYVHVHYDGDVIAKATDPATLTLLAGEA
jgi:hypothetical protein